MSELCCRKQHSIITLQTDNTVITGKEAENNEEGERSGAPQGVVFQKKKENDNAGLVSCEHWYNKAGSSELAMVRNELTVSKELQLELALLMQLHRAREEAAAVRPRTPLERAEVMLWERPGGFEEQLVWFCRRLEEGTLAGRFRDLGCQKNYQALQASTKSRHSTMLTEELVETAVQLLFLLGRVEQSMLKHALYVKSNAASIMFLCI